MAIITYLITIALFASTSIAEQEALIGEHINATYFARQYEDIQGYLSSAISDNYTIIRVSNGTYSMSKTLQINKNNITIIGTVDADNNHTTFLTLNNKNVAGLAVFASNSVANVSITNIIIDNNSTKEINGVSFVNVTNGMLQGLSLKGFRNGVFVNVSSNVSVIQVNVTSSKFDGILVRSSQNVNISNISTCCNGRHGINILANTKGAVVSFNNAFTHQSKNACGVRMESSSNMTLEGNVLYDNQINICLRSISFVQVIANKMTQINQTKCIFINGAANGQFINNECNSRVMNISSPPPPKVNAPPPPKVNAPPPPPRRRSNGYMAVMSNTLLLSGLIAYIIIA